MFTGDFLASKFVLMFRGDEPIAYLCDGFDATLEKLRGEINIPADEFAEVFANFRDDDEWTRNDSGPFAIDTEWGDGCSIQVIRIYKEE